MKIHRILAVIALLGCFGTNVQAGSIYQLTTTAMTWAQAEAEAVALGGHLVAINDAAEQAALISQFGSAEIFWIGLTDQVTEGTFVWSNGDPLTYTNWAGGQPDDSLGEDFVVMNWGSPGPWNDFGADASVRGIIELTSAVPEPGSLVLMGMGALGILGLVGRKRLKP